MWHPFFVESFKIMVGSNIVCFTSGEIIQFDSHAYFQKGCVAQPPTRQVYMESSIGFTFGRVFPMENPMVVMSDFCYFLVVFWGKCFQLEDGFLMKMELETTVFLVTWKPAVAVNLNLNLKPLKPATVWVELPNKNGTFLGFPGIWHIFR